MSPEVIYITSEYTPGLGRKVPELEAAGGGFFEVKYGDHDLNRPRSRSFGAPSSVTTPRKRPSRHHKRYTMIIEIGNGKDIPESKNDEKPKFTFELESESDHE